LLLWRKSRNLRVKKVVPDTAVYAMVLNRISNPLSKRGVNRWIEEVYRLDFSELELHYFYRALDLLAEHKKRSETGLFKRIQSLFKYESGYCFLGYHICYNPAQAEHDKKTREEMVQKLKRQLENNGVKSLVGNSGYRRYLLLKKDTAVGINQDLLKEEARYDGKHVLRTNCQLDTDEVALAYKDLWHVERAFREIKFSLDLRPVYHWKDSRVRGDIMVCFLALVL